MELELALKNSNYTKKQRECIKATFERLNVWTLDDLDNLPSKVGHICNCDIYELIAHIRAWSLEEV